MIFENIIKKTGANCLNEDYLGLQDLLFHEELQTLKNKYINKLKTQIERVNNKNVIKFEDLRKRKFLQY